MPGLPPHNLQLKVGSVVIMLRNINQPRLCNGTRLAVKKLMSNVIEATIIKGKYKGEDVLIPRIPMIPTDLPFDFKRLQFHGQSCKPVIASLRNQLGVSLFRAWTIIRCVFARRKTIIIIYLRTAKKDKKYSLSESFKLMNCISSYYVQQWTSFARYDDDDNFSSQSFTTISAIDT